MAKYEITGPDGAKYEVTAPDGASEQEVLSYFQSNMPKQQPKSGVAKDVAKQLVTSPSRGLYQGVDDMLSLFRGAGGAVARGVGGLLGMDKEQISQAGQANAVNVPKPQFPQAETQAGRRVGAIADTTAQAAMAGGAPAVIPGLLGGVGSEGMGMLFNDNPWMKALGGFALPMGVGFAQAYRNAPAQMVREAIGDTLTPEQIAAAKALQARSQQMGVPLMAPEALPDSGIQQLASNVAASRAGNRPMNEFFAQRPEQVKQAVNQRLISPIATQGTPDANIRAARTAATNVISDAEKGRSALVRPFYQAAEQDAIAPEQIRQIVEEAQRRMSTAGAAPTQAALDDIIKQVTGSPANAAALDDVYKYFREAANVGINATPAERMARGVYGPAASQLDDMLQASPNIKQGRELYKEVTRDVIDPLTSGPVGRVAGRYGVDPSQPEGLSALGAISNPSIARPQSIKELSTQLNAQNPQAFQGLARTYLENAFDTASKRIQGGENRMVGANFANAIMGTPQQEANLKEVMRGVAQAQNRNPDEVVKGVENLFEVLRMTGKVPGIGSQTAPRLSGDAMAGKSLLGGAMEIPSGRPLGPFADKVREWTMRGSYSKLADAMTSPDGIDKLVKMAKYNPKTTTGQYFAAGLLGLNSGDQSTPLQSNR